MKKKEVIAIVQARMNSQRLPGKVLLDLENKPVIIRIIERLLHSKLITKIVVATTSRDDDEAIMETVHRYYPDIVVYQGSEHDLVDRCYQAVKDFAPDAVVRITADSPLVDWQVVDETITAFLGAEADYASNAFEVKHYPIGLDVEVFSFQVLEKLWKEVKGVKEREYPSLYIRENQALFKCKKVVCDSDYSYHRWTLDEPADYELIKSIYQKLYPKNPNFLMSDILDLFKKHKELILINQHVQQQWKQY